MEPLELSELQQLFNKSTCSDSIAQTHEDAKQKQLADQQIALQKEQERQSQIALQVKQIMTQVKHILNSKVENLVGVSRWEDDKFLVTSVKGFDTAQGYQAEAIQQAYRILQQVTENTCWDTWTSETHDKEHYGNCCHCRSYSLHLTLVHRQPK